MKKLYRKWYRTTDGKKCYSISDDNLFVSVGGFTSRRKAERALREAQKEKREYIRKMKEWRDTHA